MTERIAFIGFGEAGQAIASGLRESGIERIAAWDILLPQAAGERLKAAGDKLGIRLATSAEDAVAETDLIVSAVTAASSLEAARSVEPHLTGSPWYLDINSVSPGRKQETEKLLAGKARYVDVAVVAAIHPARHRTPLLIAGPHAEAAAPLLRELDMQLSVVGPQTGAAAAIKMIRSVMIKGIEALTMECFVAASRAGIVDEVAASLKNNYPALDWNRVIEYNLERMASHGVRRADEMDQVAETLREFGIEPLMAAATAARQQWLADLGVKERLGDRKTENRAELIPLLQARLRERPAEDWLAALDAAGVPVGKVRTVPEALAAAAAAGRPATQAVDHPTAGELDLVASPIWGPTGPTSAPPLLGEHTAEVLAELGRSNEEIEALAGRGVVRLG